MLTYNMSCLFLPHFKIQKNILSLDIFDYSHF
nr:MAG TPA: hypothetical protein [Caudoviricetes sp.]